MRTLLLGLGLLLATVPAVAEVYRWTDANGQVHYGDKPPTPGAKPVELPPLQLVPGAPTSDAGRSALAEPAPVAAMPSVGVRIVSPEPDQVFRNTDRSLAVAVSVQQGLPEGGGLIYLLDGTPRTPTPLKSMTYTIQDIDRGSHLVAVAVVDAQGREMGRSEPVLFHLQPRGLH